MFVSACRNSSPIMRVFRFPCPHEGTAVLTAECLTVHFTLLGPSPPCPESELALDVLQICSGRVTCALLEGRHCRKSEGVRLSWHFLECQCPPGLKRQLEMELQHRRERTNSTQGCRNTAQTSSDGLGKVRAHLELKLARVTKKSS